MQTKCCKSVKIELAAIFGASKKQVKRGFLYFGALSVKFVRVSFEAVSRILPQDWYFAAAI